MTSMYLKAMEMCGVMSFTSVSLAEELQDLMAVTEMDSPEAARTAVDQQEAAVAVIIPANFSAAMTGSGENAEVELYQDPTLTLGPKIVSAVIRQFLDGFAGSQITINVAVQQLGVVLMDLFLGFVIFLI